jgi:hypothetical protein
LINSNPDVDDADDDGLSVWFALWNLKIIEITMRKAKAFSKAEGGNSHLQEASRKEQQTILEATAHYERFKKSASLPAYYLNKARLRKAADIYRTLSTDKLRPTRRISPAHTPLRPAPFTQLNLNSIDHAKPKSRLTLQRGEDNSQHTVSPNSAWGQLLGQIRAFKARFDELMTIRS